MSKMLQFFGELLGLMSLDGSDLVAIIALILSAIISTVTLVVTYKTNKENNRAKRLEIALAHQLTALQALTEQLHTLADKMSDHVKIKEESFTFSKYKTNLIDAYLNVLNFSVKTAIYFPKNVEQQIWNLLRVFSSDFEVIEQFTSFNDEAREYVSKSYKRLGDGLTKVIAEIQKYLGIS